ncbi:MAG: LemA family protein [Peptostreptococcaceae bacterium]|nr:LemA family protein [Peptostreptococcaceae bacterium]
MIIGLIILALIGGAVFWGINVQRVLVKLDEMCKNAMSQIGVQLNSRWDALTALADLTKGYSDHEYNALKDVISARTKITQDSSVDQVNQQEDAMSSVFGRLLAISEAYPDLKANQTYINTMNSVKEYENDVRMSRMVYNDTVTKLNSMIRQFPASLIAERLGFSQREYLQEPTGKTEMPSMVR